MKIIKFFKHNWNKIISGLCAVCISALCISDFAYASSDQWAALGEDAVALKNAYVNYVKSLSSGSISEVFGSAVDIPTSWLKTMSDGVLAISPVDDLFYFLSDGKLQYEDNRSHRAGGGGGRRRGEATEIKPDVPASYVKQVNDYWSNYYKPIQNKSEYFYDYQGTGHNISPVYSSKKSWVFGPCAPIYTLNKTWGHANWDEVYVLPAIYDDDIGYNYFCSYYYHFYATREDKEPYLNFDIISLSGGEVVSSQKVAWDSKAEVYSLCMDSGGYVRVKIVSFSSVFNWLGDKTVLNSNVFTAGQLGKYFDMISCQDYSSTGLYDFFKSVSFTPNTNKNDNWGYYMSNEPFQLYSNQNYIDFNNIPDNYVITVYGDNIYNYDIRDPVTGKHTTINNYITNNYIFPEGSDDGDDSGSGSDDSGGSGGTVSGDVSVGGQVNVSGNVDVSGKIEIDTKPIDININVNNPGSGSGSSGAGGTGDSSGGASGVEFDQDVSLNNYYDWMQEQTTGFSGFMKQFFSWLPDPIVIMLCAGFALVILARFLGR